MFYIDMKKSYRSTCEIMDFAEQILNKDSDTEYVDRHGERPHIAQVKSEEQMAECMTEDLRAGKLYRTQGVLCLTQEEADRFYRMLEKAGIEADLLTKDSMKFHTGISVMPFYLAKGLEFDAVYVPNVQQYQSPLEKQALYINATRALHQLKLYEI